MKDNNTLLKLLFQIADTREQRFPNANVLFIAHSNHNMYEYQQLCIESNE